MTTSVPRLWSLCYVVSTLLSTRHPMSSDVCERKRFIGWCGGVSVSCRMVSAYSIKIPCRWYMPKSVYYHSPSICKYLLCLVYTDFSWDQHVEIKHSDTMAHTHSLVQMLRLRNTFSCPSRIDTCWWLLSYLSKKILGLFARFHTLRSCEERMKVLLGWKTIEWLILWCRINRF